MLLQAMQLLYEAVFFFDTYYRSYRGVCKFREPPYEKFAYIVSVRRRKGKLEEHVVYGIILLGTVHVHGYRCFPRTLWWIFQSLNLSEKHGQENGNRNCRERIVLCIDGIHFLISRGNKSPRIVFGTKPVSMVCELKLGTMAASNNTKFGAS